MSGPLSYPARVERGLISFALAWQALWYLAYLPIWLSPEASGPARVAVAISMVAWVILLISHVTPHGRVASYARWLDQAALVAAMVLTLVAVSGTAEIQWSLPCSWALLPAGLAGLYFPWRVATSWLAMIVVVESAFILAVDSPGTDTNLAQALLLPGYATCVGIITISARRALLAQASRATQASTRAAHAESELEVVEAAAFAARDEERILHATVLNTLVAISQWATGPATDLLRARCVEARDVLRALQAPSSSLRSEVGQSRRLESDVSASIDELRAAGVDVHVDTVVLPVPLPVYSALVAATREALSNVVLHSRAQAVWLDARVVGSGPVRVVTVGIRDDGIGFSPDLHADGYGLREAIRQTVTDVGGDVAVSSRPGDGTSISLRWSDSGDPADQRQAMAPAPFAIPVLVALGGYAAAQFVVSWGQYERPAVNLAAFVLFTAAAAFLARMSRRAPFNWPTLIIVAAVSPLMYHLEVLALQGADVPVSAQWSSGAIAALFLVLAAGGPPWGWIPLVGVWLLIQGDVLHELYAPGTALILAAAIYGRTTRVNTSRVRDFTSSADMQRAAAAEALADLGRIQRRYSALRASHATDLLDGIADGRLDPTAPTVRSEATVEERFIRTVLCVDPTSDSVRAMATSLAVTAHRTGLLLNVDIDGDLRFDDLAALNTALTSALASSQPSGVAHLSARREDGACVLRLVTPIVPARRRAMARLPVPGARIDSVDPSDADMLWEVRSTTQRAT